MVQFSSVNQCTEYFLNSTWWGKEINLLLDRPPTEEGFLRYKIISNYLDYISIDSILEQKQSSTLGEPKKNNINRAIYALKDLVDEIILSQRDRFRVSSDTPILIGISYRSDNRGKACQHDKNCIEALKKLRVFRNFGIKVQAHIIGDGDDSNIARSKLLRHDEDAQWHDFRFLDKEIKRLDLLYIPGSPFSNDLETNHENNPENLGKEAPTIESFDHDIKKPLEDYLDSIIHGKSDVEDKKKSLTKHPAYTDCKRNIYKYLEANSRSHFELCMIERAKHHSIPILAVCAGSWRLYQSYGKSNPQYQIFKLNTENLKKHYKSGADAWSIRHRLEATVPMNSKKYFPLANLFNSIEMKSCNSTHWAECILKDIEELERIAFCNETKTVEAFIDRKKKNIMGVQFHPEGYLPGIEFSLDPENIKTLFNENIIKYSHLIFENIIFSKWRTVRKIVISGAEENNYHNLMNQVFEGLKQEYQLKESIRNKCIDPYYFFDISPNVNRCIHSRRASIC